MQKFGPRGPYEAERAYRYDQIFTREKLEHEGK